MTDFVALIDDLDATRSTNEKIDLIAAYLHSAPPADAAWAAWLLTDQRRRRTVSSRALREIFLDHASIPEWLVDESYAHVGDTAETVTLLIGAGYLSPADDPDSPDGDTAPDGPEQPLHAWMERAIPELRGLDAGARAERVVSWWRSVPRTHLFVLNKLLTGGFRLGVSRATVVKALARVAEVPASAVTLAVTGGFEPSERFIASLRTSAAHDPGRPYPFFLASPLPPEMVGETPTDSWRIEWKWDGIRAQLIRRDGTTAIWSRGEEIVTSQFPEIADAVSALPDGTVLDCELVAWRDSAPRPFHDLQRRLGRSRVGAKLLREVPVTAIVFDCLEADGRDIREEPIEARLAARDRVLDAARRSGERAAILRTSDPVVVADWEELERERRASAERNVEGFLLKRHGSPYRSGRRRGDWWKFKRDPFTLDAVLIYAQAGTGKRANLFTDYTFALRDGDALVPFAKAYSGLSNDEIAELDRWIRRNTVERFGPVRSVRPERVFEIAFEGIGPSSRHKSGVATRFPRIVRPRPDKPAGEANTLDDARRLIR